MDIMSTIPGLIAEQLLVSVEGLSENSNILDGTDVWCRLRGVVLFESEFSETHPEAGRVWCLFDRKRSGLCKELKLSTL